MSRLFAGQPREQPNAYTKPDALRCTDCGSPDVQHHVPRYLLMPWEEPFGWCAACYSTRAGA